MLISNHMHLGNLKMLATIRDHVPPCAMWLFINNTLDAPHDMHTLSGYWKVAHSYRFVYLNCMRSHDWFYLIINELFKRDFIFNALMMQFLMQMDLSKIIVIDEEYYPNSKARPIY